MSLDGTLKLWDVSSGKEVESLASESGMATCFTWSHDGQTLAWGDDNFIRIWSVPDRRLRRSITTKGTIKSLAFSPDDSKVITGGYRVPFVWDLKTGRQLQGLQAPFPPTERNIWSAIHSVAWSPNGKAVAAGTESMDIKLWDVARGNELLSLDVKTNPVKSIAFSPDGKTLAAGLSCGFVMLWDMTSGQQLLSIHAHKDRIDSITFPPDGKQLASTGSGELKLWSPISGKELANFSQVKAYCLSFDPSGRTLAIGSENAVKLLEAQSGKELMTLDAHADSVNDISCRADGKNIAVAQRKQSVRIWSLDASSAAKTISTADAIADSVAYSKDGKTLAVQERGRDGEKYTFAIRLIDIDSRKELWQTAGSNWHKPLTWSPDGKVLATTFWYGRFLKLYDSETGKELRSQTDSQSYTWSPDSKTIAVGSNDGTIDLRDVVSWKTRKSFVGYPGVLKVEGKKYLARGIVGSLAWSHNGKILASEYGGKIKLWNTPLCQ